MKKISILWTVLVLAALPWVSARAAAAPICANPASLLLDGVALELCLPFAVGGFHLPEPDNKIQVASAADAAGRYELSITAIPLGTRPGSELFPVLETGQEGRYRTLLQELRARQFGMPAGSPQVSLFGKTVSGASNRLRLKADGIHEGGVLLSEWLAEAGGRIWLVRLAEGSAGGANTLPAQLDPQELSLSARDVDAPSTSLASLKAERAAPPATPLVPQAPQANLPTPAWWSGECDTVHYQAINGRPAYPLGASFLGMPACGPRFVDFPRDTLIGFFPGAYGVNEWECVELSMRFMYLAYGVPPYGANGNGVVPLYNGTRLVKISNKTPGKAPQAGDILSYNLYASVGHTSVVTASNVDAYGNGTIGIIEENASASGARTHSVVNWNVVDSQVVIGWLHDPTRDNQLPPVVTFSPANPAPNRWYNASQTVAWASSDYVGLWGYSQAWDADPGGTAPRVTTAAAGSADFSGLAEGQHTLYVRVWDNSPDHHTQVYTSGWYGYDATPPNGTLTSFIEGQAITTRGLPVGVSLGDGGGSGVGRAQVTAAWAGQPPLEVVSNISAAGAYAWDLCTTGVPDGLPVSVSLDVWDNAGNAAPAAGGVRHFVKNFPCSTPAQTRLGQPTGLTPAYTGAANECTHYWSQFSDPNNQPAYLTLNAVGPAQSTNSARWTPNLPAAGQYKVEALITAHPLPPICHTTAPSADTAAAQYGIQHQGGATGVAVDQQAQAGQWADLGTYTFSAGTAGFVELTDLTGETNFSRYVVFSEMRFTPLAAPPACFGLNLAVLPAGGAGLTLTPPNCGNGQYTPGSQVLVTLAPAPGRTFNRWEGSLPGRSNPLAVTMDGDQALVAYFDVPSRVFLPLITH